MSAGSYSLSINKTLACYIYRLAWQPMSAARLCRKRPLRWALSLISHHIFAMDIQPHQRCSPSCHLTSPLGKLTRLRWEVTCSKEEMVRKPGWVQNSHSSRGNTLRSHLLYLALSVCCNPLNTYEHFLQRATFDDLAHMGHWRECRSWILRCWKKEFY